MVSTLCPVCTRHLLSSALAQTPRWNQTQNARKRMTAKLAPSRLPKHPIPHPSSTPQTPSMPLITLKAETGLPSGWEVRHSNSKNLPYYFHPTDKVSRWEPPPGTDPEKLSNYMATNHSTTQPTAATAQVDTTGKIRAGHLLVKHKDSRRPASWRESNITRTKEEAMEIIKDYEARIRSGETCLRALATTESDCVSARKEGDLGYFGRGDMQKEFEDAVFALEVGQVSGVVETQSGLHLIERID